MKLKDLTDLANALRGLDNYDPKDGLGFDMEFGYHNRDDSSHICGSACCIGGWVQHFNPDTRDLTLAEAVATITPWDIESEEVENLCYPVDVSSTWKASPQQAARAVEILRDTGRCDWDRAMLEGAK